MKRSLIRSLAFVGALAIPSLAAATEYGTCYVYCSDGRTYGPYSSTSASCCNDLQTRCGGSGNAFTRFGTYPNMRIEDCYIEEPLAAGWAPGSETSHPGTLPWLEPAAAGAPDSSPALPASPAPRPLAGGPLVQPAANVYCCAPDKGVICGFMSDTQCSQLGGDAMSAADCHHFC